MTRTLVVRTAHVSTTDPDALDVTRQRGVTAFAPSWDLLLPFVRRRKENANRPASPAEWARYAEAYTDEMRASWHRDERPWTNLLAKSRVVLVCMCAHAEQCHRTVLGRDILPKFATVDLAIRYEGEIESKAARRRRESTNVVPLFPEDADEAATPQAKVPETTKRVDPYGRRPLESALAVVADHEEAGPAGFGLVLARRDASNDLVVTAEYGGRSPWGRTEMGRWAHDLERQLVDGRCHPSKVFEEAERLLHVRHARGLVFARAEKIASAYRLQAVHDTVGTVECVDVDEALRRFAASVEDDVWANPEGLIEEVRKEMESA